MIGTFNDPVADSYDGSRTWPQSAMESFLAGLKFLLADGLALEVGVGAGRIGLPLRERGVNVVGLDISARELNRLARQYTQESPTDLGLVQIDAISLPVSDSSFNGVYSLQVFHLLKEWEQSLAEIERGLIPHGG